MPEEIQRPKEFDDKLIENIGKLKMFCLKLRNDEEYADEIVQATLLRALIKYHQFDSSVNDNMFPWLCTIAFNIRLQRRNWENNFYHQLLEDVYEHHYSDSNDLHPYAITDEKSYMATVKINDLTTSQENLHTYDANAIANVCNIVLTPNKKKVLSLAAKGFRYEEIGKITNQTTAAIKQSIYTTRGILAVKIGEIMSKQILSGKGNIIKTQKQSQIDYLSRHPERKKIERDLAISKKRQAKFNAIQDSLSQPEIVQPKPIKPNIVRVVKKPKVKIKLLQHSNVIDIL